MSTKHELVGYDRRTGQVFYAKAIPAALLGRIRALVGDDGSPGCLELTQSEAAEVSKVLGATDALPDNVDFFLE